jgi:hypothetical protein
VPEFELSLAITRQVLTTYPHTSPVLSYNMGHGASKVISCLEGQDYIPLNPVKVLREESAWKSIIT